MKFKGETESQKARRETALLDMLIESRRGIWNEKYSHVQINESEHGITSFWRHDSPSFVSQIFSREMFLKRAQQINAMASGDATDKQQLAAMGEHMAEHAAQAQPMCMAKRIEELEAKLEKLTNRLAWRNTASPNGLRRFMTQKQYKAQAPGIQKWYEPIRYEVPEGWQLVPRMPTTEMCDAFKKADADWEDGWAFDDNGNRHGSPVYQWVAMLAAAPKPDSNP